MYKQPLSVNSTGKSRKISCMEIVDKIRIKMSKAEGNKLVEKNSEYDTILREI